MAFSSETTAAAFSRDAFLLSCAWIAFSIFATFLTLDLGTTEKTLRYMWLYRTSGCAKQAIVLYEYQPTRKAEHAEAFLKSFSGWLHADGYQGYHRLPGNIRVVGC